MKHLATLDRELLEGASTAFMAFLRAYKEHMCSYIFRITQLDLGSVARSYALLRLPKIPETRGASGSKIKFESTPFNTSQIPYRHREKEQARQRRLQALHQAEEKAMAGKKRKVPGSGGVGAGADSDDDDEDDDDDDDIDDSASMGGGKSVATSQSKKEKTWVPADQYVPPPDEKRKRKKKQSAQKKFKTEWDELAAEEMAFRKMKKGKLSSEEYTDLLVSDEILELDAVLKGRGADDSDSDAPKKSKKRGNTYDDSDSESDSEGQKPKKDWRRKHKGRVQRS